MIITLTDKQATTLGLILRLFPLSSIKPEARNELNRDLGELSLMLQVAKGETTQAEADDLLRLARR